MSCCRCRISTLLIVAWLVALALGFAQTYNRWVASHPTTKAYDVGARLATARDASRPRPARSRSDVGLLLIPAALGVAFARLKRSSRSGLAGSSTATRIVDQSGG